ncbi:hypothetical protein BKA58DRAFT_101806 [Alternaria rosae]|uniref:uncharacterized protein n=1 Tax=Alternaria rosae TaxID=1187941 RepID=UPI001E8EABCA|nr:uncharacterized protein BKA58DRAFT_101806 [Alternaria rosae]KAH6878712.1 hypothetical protein BKA58DRAFT_101806 [Alternaria rosae]
MDDAQSPPPPYPSTLSHSSHHVTPTPRTPYSNTRRDNRRSAIRVAFWPAREGGGPNDHVVYSQEDSQLQEGHGDDDSIEEDELLEGERSDGGVRLPNAYIENNEDARGVEIERRNGLEPHGTLDKTIELREGETDILRVENGTSPARQPHPFALCARTLLKLPCRQKKRTWSMCIRHLLNMNSGFCPGPVAICRAETKPLYSTQEDQHKYPHCGISVRLSYPQLYYQGWPTYQGRSCSFILKSHLPDSANYGAGRRGCLISWEYECVWAGATDDDEWGKHMRRHFEDEGYWVCEIENNKRYMMDKGDCKARKCKAVHS